MSDTLTVNTNGTKDVTNYRDVLVSVPTGTARTVNDLTVSGATVTVPAGLYSTNASKAVANGTQGTPTAQKGDVSNNQVTITPKCTDTTGYITGATKTGTAVTVKASDLVSGTLEITSNGEKDVTNYQKVNVSISGGEGKNIQYNTTMVKLTNKSSYTTTGCEITVAKSGNYKCSWIYYAGASSNASSYGSRLYKNGSAVGTAKTGAYYSANSGWNVSENSLSLSEGDTITVYAKTRSGSSYFVVAGFLVIEEI